MSKSLQEIADSIILMEEDERQSFMKEKPTKIMVFGQDIPDYLLLMRAKMNDEEYRDLVASGPAVVMVEKEYMLKLLNRIILLKRANQLADEIIAMHKEEND